MKIIEPIVNRSQPSRLYRPHYALRREGSVWHVTFGGQESSFRHELGALYVAYLLLAPPREPLHAVAIAVNARERLGRPGGPDDLLQQRAMGLDQAATVRALWRRQRELERVLQDRLEIEPVKAEAQRELEEITEHLRQSPWLSRHGAERCARAVAKAILHFYASLATAVDAEGHPEEVLRAFALHLHDHLLLPSGRGGGNGRSHAWTLPGCFIYVPPRGVEWSVECRVPSGEWRGGSGTVRGSEFAVQRSKFPQPRPAAVEHLSRFLCVGYALALALTGCAGPRPLKGGKAIFTHKPAGVVEQTLVQSENPAQATRQDQESVKVRTYTVPAGSRVDQFPAPSGGGQECPRSCPQPSTLDPQPSTTFTLGAPMPVVEREETRARAELGAAQKDTARELGAKLASLKGIVWVGVGLFVFGLASLVWPPLKAVIGSVTTSAACALGGIALMILPTLVVGNELLILGGVALAVGGWFLAHRHGELKGRLKAEG
jgi:hypothetical protein